MSNMKKCSKCKKEKPLTEFNKNPSKKDGLQYYCKLCQAAATKIHYERTKQVYIDRAVKHRSALRTWMKEYKETLKCNRCEESHPACLDFHHQGDKDFNISKAIASGKNKEQILAEIAKCEVVCSNCHRKIHYEERHAE